MKPSLVALIVVGAVASQRAAAQAIAHTDVVNRPVVADTTPRFTNGDSFLIRSLTGALGFVGGAAAGYGLAAATGPYHCHCDGVGVSPGLAGVLLGGTFGAALGASAPKLRAQCPFAARMLRSTAGSVVGTVVGIAIGFNVGDRHAAAVGMPLGAALGASTALIGC